ncbi:hypothetical protein BDZ45DRAFT_83806 [Acephala macrosclerotiorum]|nr:hypothetical protein BDZ45DRAFT_83806 [Acephala macrosclerotiorum]
MEHSTPEFTLFPHLPTELRDKIWLLSLPTEPRLIPYAATDTPSIAAVNQESRLVFLSVYTKCFLPGSSSSMKLLPYPISPYANLSTDTLFLLWDVRPSDRYPYPLDKWMTPEAIVRIKHVAVGLGLWISLRLHMPEFAGLESLTFVMGMGHRHEKLKSLRHSGRLVEIDEQHDKWEHNKSWWEELNEDERRGWDSLKVALAEIVETDPRLV